MRLIDADAFEVVAYKGIPEGYNDTFGDGVVWILKKIDAQPAIEPQPKTGKWIFVHPLQKDDSGAYMCSCCKNGDWDIKLTDRFCKFCGAKMVKDSDVKDD